MITERNESRTDRKERQDRKMNPQGEGKIVGIKDIFGHEDNFGCSRLGVAVGVFGGTLSHSIDPGQRL